jgi:hypothetical protein
MLRRSFLIVVTLQKSDQIFTSFYVLMTPVVVLQVQALIGKLMLRQRSCYGKLWTNMKIATNRRSFLKNGLAAGATAAGMGLLTENASALADDDDHGERLTRGDAALLRFAAAAEILETDFWVQYNELAGIQDKEEPSGSGNPAYAEALAVLDEDMAQYVHDNTDDEFTHQNFLNAYLASKGAATVDLEQFRTLQGSTATGSSGKLRLTNLMRLTLDTSWWTRYRDDSHNPDLDPNFTFPQAVPTLFTGEHTAIPRTDDDTKDPNFLQAIANTAAFHFPTIEQGGNSLYPAMAQRATSVEVLRILISIGPTETMHFQTWSDKASNAPQLTDVVDPVHKSIGDISRSELSSVWRRGVPDEPDHAGAVPVSEPETAGVLDHSSNGD